MRTEDAGRDGPLEFSSFPLYSLWSIYCRQNYYSVKCHEGRAVFHCLISVHKVLGTKQAFDKAD